jgi:hypothetical protein
MAIRTTTAALKTPLEEVKKQGKALLNTLYGTKERAQRTIGLAYLMLAIGLIMQSAAYNVVCTAY